MKHLFTLLLALGMMTGIQAQKVGFWFDAGLKGGVGPSFLLNNNIFDDDFYDHQLTTGYSVGAKFGIFKGLYNGITFDVMYSNGAQDFRAEGMDQPVDHNINWTSTDLAVLYRLQKQGIYLELGPMFSWVNSVEQTGFDPSDVTEFYSENMTSAVFGFGGYLLSSGNFTLMFGLRASYGFTDFISEAGQDANYPNPMGEAVPYDSYESTNPINVQLTFEANFGLGYFAKTACSKRMSFFRFD
jgi:hypothetical protein